MSLPSAGLGHSLANAQFLTRLELRGDGVPPQPPMRLMTPTGRLASVGACLGTPLAPSLYSLECTS